MSKILFSLIKKLHIDANAFYRVLQTNDNLKYKTFYKPKRNGGKRLIEAPIDPDLILIQQRFKNLLDKEYVKYLPSCVHGYIKERNIVSNAKAHVCGAHEYIIKIDIRNFFNSISYERLFGLFYKVWFNKKTNKSMLDNQTINAMCIISTCNKHLPQGSCISPVLSNMVCKRMDRQLCEYAKKYNAIYTRYADDITFSVESKDDLPAFLNGNFPYGKSTFINHNVISIILDNGFEINKNKFRLISKNRSQYIAGIVINKKINVRRQYIRNVRACLHNVEHKKCIPPRSLIGKINHIRQVRGKEDILACKYAVRLNRLMKPPFPDADFIVDQLSAIHKYVIGIETSNGYFGTGFFLLMVF